VLASVVGSLDRPSPFSLDEDEDRDEDRVGLLAVFEFASAIGAVEVFSLRSGPCALTVEASSEAAAPGEDSRVARVVGVTWSTATSSASFIGAGFGGSDDDEDWEEGVGRASMAAFLRSVALSMTEEAAEAIVDETSEGEGVDEGSASDALEAREEALSTSELLLSSLEGEDGD
jgi:hypothetical protein